MVKSKMVIHKILLLFAGSLIAGLVLFACGAGPTPAPAADAKPAPTGVATEAPAAAPTNAPAEAPSTVVSFTNEVMPILQSRCLNCHGGDRTEAGLSLRTYEDIMAGSENGPVIAPGDAANSLLVELVANQKMPKRGPKLTPSQVQLITDWVNSGAPNN